MKLITMRIQTDFFKLVQHPFFIDEQSFLKAVEIQDEFCEIIHRYKIGAALVLCVLFLSTIQAAPPPAPPEAIDACAGLNERDSCSFTHIQGTVEGICRTIDTQLSCAPESNTPPPEAGNKPGDGTKLENEDTPIVNSRRNSFDESNNTLSLVAVSVDDKLYFQVSLKLISVSPIRLNLSELTEIDRPEQSSATYGLSSEILQVPEFSYKSRLYSLKLKLVHSEPEYQFELLSMEEIEMTDTGLFNVLDTGQSQCYNSNGANISCSNSGQDGAYTGNQASYTRNDNGTVTDNITGLIWQQSPDTNGDGSVDISDKLTHSAASSYCSGLTLANQSDWRLPDIKSMYSLIDFSGHDVSNFKGGDTSKLTPFIDTEYFEFAYGDTNADERIIDVQYATSSLYVSTTMNGDETMFGVNMADGRIKGYGVKMRHGQDKTFTVQCVRANENYAINNFSDNNDDTVSDSATGLIWQKNDSLSTKDWDEAISYCENGGTADYSDWRLPNAKELQSLVDYTRSPDSSNSAAIDPVFNASWFNNEAGEKDWGYYWSSTTHKSMAKLQSNAVYISFGRALGYMNNQWLDVHGAGAQRSAPKSASIQLDQSYKAVIDSNGYQAITHGPQGDLVRINNYVRCVRSDL